LLQQKMLEDEKKRLEELAKANNNMASVSQPIAVA